MKLSPEDKTILNALIGKKHKKKDIPRVVMSTASNELPSNKKMPNHLLESLYKLLAIETVMHLMDKAGITNEPTALMIEVRMELKKNNIEVSDRRLRALYEYCLKENTKKSPLLSRNGQISSGHYEEKECDNYNIDAITQESSFRKITEKKLSAYKVRQINQADDEEFDGFFTATQIEFGIMNVEDIYNYFDSAKEVVAEAEYNVFMRKIFMRLSQQAIEHANNAERKPTNE